MFDLSLAAIDLASGDILVGRVVREDGVDPVRLMKGPGGVQVELRAMLDDATDLAPGARQGRWIVTTSLGGRPWTVVVEPDFDDRVIFVVTAYEREIAR